MTILDDILKKYGLVMPDPTVKAGVYDKVKEFGSNFCYLSGCTPTFNGELRWAGKVGKELSIEQGQEAARLCGLNLLANFLEKYGNLEKIKQIVKILVFVAGSEDFFQQPKVANGASELFVDILGEEAGCGARSAIGVYTLPGNAPVEVEMLIELNL